jgi:hypothetical protein
LTTDQFCNLELYTILIAGQGYRIRRDRYESFARVACAALVPYRSSGGIHRRRTAGVVGRSKLREHAVR